MSISDAAQNSSPEFIQESFQKRVVRVYLPEERWLGPLNRYRKDLPLKLADDLNPEKPCCSVKPNQLADYLSTSTITHCFDGWNYLSRSIESTLSGDMMAAIHLAYYAELRAVMSLMATQGIGVFKNKHVWFDQSGSCNRVPGSKSTNPFANEILNEWAKTQKSKDFLFSVISINSIQLNQWLNSTPYGSIDSVIDYLLKDWLEKWSIDLKLEEDKDIRNEVSYRPKIYEKHVNHDEIVKKVTYIWEACEPSETSSFDLLDKHLLKASLDVIYNQYVNNSTLHKPVEKSDFVAKVLTSVGLNSTGSLHDFLSKTTNTHFILETAKNNIQYEDSYCYTYDCFPIICRALLLLRLATGATEKFLDQSITKDLTRFWWYKIGLNAGLWSKNSEPEDFKDLYQDISEAINELDFSDSDKWDSLKTASSFYAPELTSLKQFQRVGLWGIGL